MQNVDAADLTKNFRPQKFVANINSLQSILYNNRYTEITPPYLTYINIICVYYMSYLCFVNIYK